MLTIKRFAAPLVAFALPVLLATSALAQGGKMMGHKSGGKMSGGKMMGHKTMGNSMMSFQGLVPLHGTTLSNKSLMGAKIVKTTMMNGHKFYDVRLKNGKTIQMCKASDKKMMIASHSMMGGKMMNHSKMGGSMSGHKMGGKM